jgi:hypothetical protein
MILYLTDIRICLSRTAAALRCNVLGIMAYVVKLLSGGESMIRNAWVNNLEIKGQSP